MRPASWLTPSSRWGSDGIRGRRVANRAADGRDAGGDGAAADGDIALRTGGCRGHQDRRGTPWFSSWSREPHRAPPPSQSHHLTAGVLVLSVACPGSPRSAWKPSRRYLSIRRTCDGVRCVLGRPGECGDRHVSTSTARHLRQSEASSLYQCRRRWRCHAVHRLPNRCLGDPRRLDERWRKPHQHG